MSTAASAGRPVKRPSDPLLTAVVGSLLVLTGCVAQQAPEPPSSADLTATAEASVATSTSDSYYGPADEHEAFSPVDEVIDGDTIRVFIEDYSTPIRILGVNTPETKNRPKEHPEPECYGPEATAKMHDLVDGTAVILTIDPTQGSGKEHQDRYGRWLRYITTGDTGVDVSEYLIRWGFGRYVQYDGPLARTDIYKAAEADAKANNRGGWAACGW